MGGCRVGRGRSKGGVRMEGRTHDGGTRSLLGSENGSDVQGQSEEGVLENVNIAGGFIRSLIVRTTLKQSTPKEGG